MTRYLWLSVSVCCAAALWSACGPPPNSCRVSADCFPDEVCESNLCVPKLSEDGGTELSDAGTGGGDGTTGGGDGTTGGGDGTPTGGGSATGGGSVTGGGNPTGGGEGVDAGMPDCEAGDTLPCCSGRGVQTCDSSGTWSACDATVSSESCNGIDDDCNGTVDNDVLFSMPDGGVAMNVSCSIGVGACESNGSLACATDGGVVCGAPVIEPVTEVCDGIDNDCDGQTDEGTKVLCMIDADNDHYAGSSVQQEFCPDTTRSDFGNCPVGYVATSLGTDCADSDPSKYQNLAARTDADHDRACVGTETMICSGAQLSADYLTPASCAAADDCNDSNASLFVTRSVRVDADGDTYCTAAPATGKCTDGTAPTGFALDGDCKATIDCDDAVAAVHLLMDVRPDDDNDGYCAAVATTQACTDGTSAPPGFKSINNCHSHFIIQIGTTTRVIDEDCNDTQGTGETVYRNEYLKVDADGDQYCTQDAEVLTCIGANAPTGTRILSSCARVGGQVAVDCEDRVAYNGATKYQNLYVYPDADNDGYCNTTTTIMQCTGATPQPGYKLAAGCANDCNDRNSYAGATCTQTVTGTTNTKSCGIGIAATEAISFNYTCPNGFKGTSALFTKTNTPGQISDPASNPMTLTTGNTGGFNHSFTNNFTCRSGALGTDSWQLKTTCTAVNLF